MHFGFQQGNRKSIAVLGFQLFILITMFFSGMFGKGMLTTATVVWVALKLFGSIFTFGLMALQLITIYFSYQLSWKVWNKGWE